MLRSKSSTSKRHRLSNNRQVAREKESLNSMDQAESRKEMEKRLKRFGKIELKEIEPSEIKISSVILEMLKPLLDQANSIKDEKQIIQMGIIAWNLGVIKTYESEEAMLSSIQDMRPRITEEILEKLMEYVERKCSKYKKYDQFIYDYQIKRLPGPSLNLSVAYESVNDS